VSSRIRVGIVALVAIAMALQIFLPSQDTRQFDTTTYGTLRNGFRVLHDLLVELGAPVERFHDEVGHLPSTATAWWIRPSGFCAGTDVASELMASQSAWIDGGGTAVVVLPDRITPDDVCRFSGETLALRDRDDTKGILTGLGPDRAVDTHLRTISKFDDGWTVRVHWATKPFVLERAQGRGRLVVIADGRILENGTLADDEGASLFAVDLVRAYGAPRFVEADQGLLDARSRSAILYLARSPAIALFAGLVLTGVLVAWRGALVPPRTIDDDPLPAPTLTTFVGSLARLYAGSRDYGRLLARYRDLTARRLRAHLGLPPHASLDAVVERIERTRPAVRGVRAALVEDRAATPDAFSAAVARLDSLAAEVIG
jgi:hypothetical protein